MPLYEHVFITRQDISPQQVDTLTDHLKSIIKEGGGEVAKTEYWGLRSLAYRIKKNRKGHYSLLNIDAPYDAVSEMERQMRINEDVMRYLTIRVDALDPEPSVVMASKGSRDSRGRGEGRRDGPRDEPRKEAAADSPAAETEKPAAAAEKPAAAADDGAASDAETTDSKEKSGAEE